MRFTRPLALAVLLTAPFILPAVADDRPPTPDERARIEAVLTAEGYTSWDEIDLDDGKVWEVDDAVHSDGHKYDLELDVRTLAIVDRDRD